MILILGGTAEARALAQRLDDAGRPVISSLAGRVARPRLPAGETRIGGFGGPDRLATWLRDHDIDAVVDATHPFAARISASAAVAAPAAGVPLMRLERPGWTAGPDDDWHRVPDLDAAAAAITRHGARRVFLTSGRQGLAAFAPLADPWFLIRCVDPPETDLPARHEVLLDRGPYTLDGERELLERHRIDLLVTKDSGGDHTAPKLDAARERGIPVVVVDRPPRPAVPTVPTVEEALAWLP
ncbi:MAG: cobalt-precorrin-6A reductase [Solirubrobacteraceae bacterium]|nr:cobalt-precorrin-6A reductase [Solirubrobacteraceae bacterium]